MNMKPDEAKLAQWLDDELHGEELAAFEEWVSTQPEHLAAREEVRRWRRMMSSTMPASEEPPYPELFNARVVRAIKQSAADPEPVNVVKPRISWVVRLMPLAACAGMVLAFWLGAKTNRAESPEIDVAGAPKAIPVEPIIYTPDSGVEAEWFRGNHASVIVLNGVEAIPDSIDFHTASVPTEREIDSTAAMERENWGQSAR
jgi:hypothetical protein